MLPLFIKTGQAYAVDPPSITVNPSTINPFQSFTVIVELCESDEQIRVGFKRSQDITYEGWLTLSRTDSNGRLERSIDNMTDPGVYSARINCKGQNWDFANKLTVNELDADEITITHEQDGTGAKLLVGGCPPNSEVLIDWRRYHSSGVLMQSGQLEDTSDADGNSESNFPEPGDYIVDAACGGANSPDYSFTITSDGSTHVFPTQPPPPEPPCNNLSDGKCLSVDTAIGVINTNGAEILYSIFVILLSLSGGIMVIIIMYAGYLLMTSRGNPEQIQKAREMLIAAITGFLFIVFSYVILGVITTDILHLPGFGYDVDCVIGPC